LAQSEFIAAERITIADILAAISIDFARMARFRPPEELAHVGRWYAAMMERPAAKAGV
jgi:glutathione S-transferase